MILLLIDLLASLFLPLLMGYLLVLNLWPGAPTSRHGYLLRVIMAAGFGLGVASLITFFSLNAGRPATALAFVAELGICLVLTIVLLSRNIPLRSFVQWTPGRLRAGERPLLLVLVMTAALGLISFAARTLRAPHGSWDAWAIWNLHARFLFRGGTAWTRLFELSFSHPDYPLLLPVLVARGWFYAGQETQLVPAMLAMLYAALTIGLLTCALARLRETAQGLLAGAVLAATPVFMAQAAGQLADVPLSFYFLCALVCVALSAETTNFPTGLTVLAGLAAGCAAWTKDEGALFLLLLGGVHFLERRRAIGWPGALKASAAFMAGALPGAVAWLYVKLILAQTPRFIASLTPAYISQVLLQPARYLLLGREFFNGMLRFGGWPLPIGIVLVGYLLLMGASPKQGARVGFTIAVLMLALMLAGYFGVYALSPAELNWHVKTSLERLLLQLWPSFLFAYFLVVRLPARSGRGT